MGVPLASVCLPSPTLLTSFLLGRGLRESNPYGEAIEGSMGPVRDHPKLVISSRVLPLERARATDCPLRRCALGVSVVQSSGLALLS